MRNGAWFLLWKARILLQIIEWIINSGTQVPWLQGISLYYGSRPLLLRQGLRQQGFESRSVVSYVYTPVKLKEAWSCWDWIAYTRGVVCRCRSLPHGWTWVHLSPLGFLKGAPVADDEFALEGVTHIKGIKSLKQLHLGPCEAETKPMEGVEDGCCMFINFSRLIHCWSMSIS